MDKYILKKNGIPYGKLLINTKKFAVIAGLSLSLISFTGCKQEEVKHEEVSLASELPNLNKDYVVDYTINYNDTLQGLVYAYISTDNVNHYVDLIARKNKIDNPNNIREGATIQLIGVKEKYLEPLGYTVDEDIIPYEIQLRDRLNFINEHMNILKYNKSKTQNLDYKDDLEEVINQIDALNEYVSGGNYDISSALEESKKVCLLITDVYGNDYDDYKTAYKISDLEKKEHTK